MRESAQVAAAAELDALEKNVALRRTIAQPSPQDGLAHFTAESESRAHAIAAPPVRGVEAGGNPRLS